MAPAKVAQPLRPNARIAGAQRRKRGGLVALAAALFVLLALVASNAGSLFDPATRSGPGVGSPATAPHQAAEAYGKLPLRFEANRGQTDPRVDFMARGAGYSLFLTPREAVLSLSKPGAGEDKAAQSESAVVRMRLAGANPSPRGAGVRRLPGETNYLRGGDHGKSQTGVPGFARVRYQGVYPGVDLLYYGRQGRLEYDFRVAAGVDPGRIALDFGGARKLSLDREGNLDLETAGGTIRHEKPFVYQQVGGERRVVSSRFVLRRGKRVGFRLGAYDRSRPLVIDPVVVYSTYLGGLSFDWSTAIAVDSSGSAYVTGLTASPDFPTSNALRGAPNRAQDAFVAKLNPTGSALVYSTYLGGADSDEGTGIAVDSTGAAYVAGDTHSSDFPTTGGAFDRTCGTRVSSQCQDPFLAKLAPDGSNLSYSTYLGGDDDEQATGGVAVDGSGGAYVAGVTQSADFPTVNPMQASRSGAMDPFVTKVNPSGSALAYSTYLGGRGDDEHARGIALDSSNNAYVTGSTDSPDFPTTEGALDRSCSACDGGGDAYETDAFVSKLNASGSALVYSTFLGSKAKGHGIAVGRGGSDAGRAYVFGETGSTGFPTTEGAYDRTCGINPSGDSCFTDAFVTKLNTAGSGLEYSTYLGGEDFESEADEAHPGLAVDAAGSAYVAGTTQSSDFPQLRPVADTASGGAFATKLNPDGSGLAWSTVLGPSHATTGSGVAVDPAGVAYLTGATWATDFPTQNPFLPKSARKDRTTRDAFVAKLAPDDPQAPYITGVTPEGDNSSGGRTVEISGIGFADATAVKFGDVSARSFSVESPTRIVAVSPPHGAGETRVTVTAGGRSSPPNPISRFVYGEGRWTSTAPLPGRFSYDPRPRVAAPLRDGRVLVAGGDTTDAHLYDPKTGSWSPTGSSKESRFASNATLLGNGKVLVVGDYFGVGGRSAELYDPQSGTWDFTRGAPTQDREEPTATLLPTGKVLVVGDTTAELYDPESDSFTPTGAPNSSRRNHTATLLRNGKVLVAGGGASGDSAELYDPASGSWTETGGLRIGRQGHTATLLLSGKVLVVGGQGSGSDYSTLHDTAELYDPATGTWSLTRRLAYFRVGHAATLLLNGKVLVVGGGFGAPADAELYDPALGGGNGGFVSAGVTNAKVEYPTATVLSSDPSRFAADPGICGSYCGRVLLVGGGTNRAAELYTPAPDTTAPAPPTITSPANNSYDRDGNFWVTGTAEPGSTVRLYEGTTLRGEATAAPSGAWAVALAGVPDGRHTYIATATDPAGNPSSPSSPVTVIVDRIRPTVQAVSPAAGATGVSTAANVLAAFSEPMRASTIARKTVVLVRKGTRGAVAAKVTYDPARRRAKLDPHRALARGATYTAKVTTGTRDLAGNPLARAKSWSFKTRR